MQRSQLKLMGAVAAVAVIAGGGVGVWSVMKDDSDGNVLLSAEAGAEARAEHELRLPASAGDSQAVALDSKIAADALPIDCGTGSEPYVPSEEELASANADTDALTAVLDKYGIAYEVITDPSGFKYVENDYRDMVTVSVVSSFWDVRYPTVPPTQAELDDAIAQNDVIAAALDKVDVSYTRSTDNVGWEVLDWDYEDPNGQAAVDAAYLELFPPEPPTAEQLATMTSDNDTIAAAFEAAGIEYTRTSDELGWEWIDWDYDDAAVYEKVDAVFAELYPSEPGDECPMLMDDSVARDGAEDGDEPVSVDAGEGEPAAAVEESIAPSDDFTAEEITQRDAEAASLASRMEAAGVTVRTEGESPWQVVLFDTNNDAAVEVVASVLAARG